MTEPDLTNFDWQIYLFKYPDLIENGVRTKNDACIHYKNIGYLENRSCEIPSSFDAERYIRLYRNMGITTPKDAYIHYKKVGAFFNRVKNRANEAIDLSIFQQKTNEELPIRKANAPKVLHPLKQLKPKPNTLRKEIIVKEENIFLPSSNAIVVATATKRRPRVPSQLHPLKPKSSIVRDVIIVEEKQVATFPAPPTPKPVTLPRRRPIILSKPTKTPLPTTNIILSTIQPQPPHIKKPTPIQNTFKPIRQSQLPKSRFNRGYQPSIVKLSNAPTKKPISTPLLSILTMNKRNIREPKPGQLVLTESPSSYFGKLGVLGPPRYLN